MVFEDFCVLKMIDQPNHKNHQPNFHVGKSKTTSKRSPYFQTPCHLPNDENKLHYMSLLSTRCFSLIILLCDENNIRLILKYF